MEHHSRLISIGLELRYLFGQKHFKNDDGDSNAFIYQYQTLALTPIFSENFDP